RLRRAAAGRTRRGRARRVLRAGHRVAGEPGAGGRRYAGGGPMTATVAPATVVAPPPAARRQRGGYLDALRAGSLLVVVLWHLLATKLTWSADGPHATNPLGSVPGLWLGTWVLQVMPVFFYIGGCLHRRSFRPGYLRYRLVGLVAIAAPL